MRHVFTNTFGYNVVYVYTIPDDAHRGRVKIGETTLTLNPLEVIGADLSTLVRSAARKRIDEQTKTADVPYDLLHCEIAVTKSKTVFHDWDVHNVLQRSGHERKSIRKGNREWFEVDIETVKQAIEAVKNGRDAVDAATPTASGSAQSNGFPFRPEQWDAITKTVKYFHKNKTELKPSASFLWNAKMRFGKCCIVFVAAV